MVEPISAHSSPVHLSNVRLDESWKTESLGILGSIPALCGAVGVGLYGNDDVHNGMLELLTAGRAIDDMISSVKNQRALAWWKKLLDMGSERLPKKAYLKLKDMESLKDNKVDFNWVTQLHFMFSRIGADDVWERQEVSHAESEALVERWAANSISSDIEKTSTIDSTLKLKVEYLLTQLSDVFDEPVTNQTARGVLLGVLDAMTSNTTLALNSLQDIARPLKPVSLSPAISTLQLAEAIRCLSLLY
uniref:Protein tweety homolog n=1 Tax=Rhodnius prolixus TaxID=13249 RepID=T1HYY1_RHOPR